MLQLRGDHPELARILTLHDRVERFRQCRIVATQGLALVGGACWLVLVRHQALSPLTRLLVVGGWMAIGLVVVVLWLLECWISHIFRSTCPRGAARHPNG